MIHWEVVQVLNEAAWPADGSAHRTFGSAHSEEDFFGVLRQKAGTRLQHSSLTAGFAFHRNGSTDGIAIAPSSSKSKGNRRRQVFDHVLQHTQLWRVAILEHDFQPSIVIKVRQRERTAIFDEVHSHGPGD